MGGGSATINCISRVVDRCFVLGDAERGQFMARVGKLEGFLGLRDATYCVMSNHFHPLVEVADGVAGGKPGRDGVLLRLKFLYDRAQVDSVRRELERVAAAGDRRWEEEIFDRYGTRMGDISVFMKELKQRFPQWFNRATAAKAS